MEITVQSTKAVKPANGGGSSWDTQSADVIPLSVFDEVHDEYMSTIHAFHPPAPTNATLEAGLSTALAEYREWAGRLRVDPSTGCRAILLNDAGVRFVEATADIPLDAIMPLRPMAPVVARLLPAGGDDDGVEELMLVQVTRFACGSLVVGQTTHHAVGDGLAICHCLLAWGQATRGVAIDPVPVHDRESLFLPRDPLHIEIEHRGTEFKPRDVEDDDDGRRGADKKEASGGDGDGDVLVVQKLQFSREFMSALKSRASAGRLRPYSTVQCLVAHLWRCMTMARGVDGGEVTRLHIAVNGRARLSQPPVPEGYTGNVVLWAHPATTAWELLASPLGHSAELIRQEAVHVDEAYFRSFIDFMSSGVVEEEELEPMADEAQCPDGEVYCLHRIPFYDIDFGGGQQFFFMPSYSPADGVIYILPPSPHSDGGVEVHVSLFSRAMDAFKDCCYSLVVPDILLL